MKLSDVWREPRFESNSEREYAVSILIRRERVIARFFLLMRIFSWLPILLLWHFGKIRELPAKILFYFGVIQAVFCVGMLLSKAKTTTLQYTVYYLLITSQAVWFAAAFVDTSDGTGSSALLRTWLVLMTLGNLFFPMRNHHHHKVIIITLPAVIWAAQSYPMPILGTGLAIFGLVWGQNMAIITHRMAKNDAINSFREKSRYVPRQVLMKASQENSSIQDVFSPKDRYCVCLCSDWSRFKALLTDENMTDLGESMATYYEQVVRILLEKFPEGQFFIDWIADELFIVIFAENNVTQTNLVIEAFEAARKISQYHLSFTGQKNIQSGIDIGASCGIASVGIYGTGGIAKATAFGQPPGRARRTHSICAKLRRLHGDVNRIVMTAEFAAVIRTGGMDMSMVQSEITNSTKNISGEALYVWPPISASGIAGTPPASPAMNSSTQKSIA